MSSEFYQETTLAMLNHTRRHVTERWIKWRDWAILLGVTGHQITVLIVALGIKLREDEPSVTWYLDPTLSVCLQYRKFFLSVILTVYFLFFHLYRIIRHRPLYRFYVGNLVHDMLVTNYQHFHRSLLVDEESSKKHFLELLKYWWRVGYRREHFNWNKFANSKLVCLSYISARFRFQIALCQRALSLGIYLIQPLSYLMFAVVLYQTVPQAYHSFPYWQTMWPIAIPTLVIDYVALFFQLVFWARLLWYVLLFYNLILLCMIQKLKPINRKLGCMRRRLVQRNTIGRRFRWFRRLVGHQLGRHLICCLRVKQVNQEFVSETLCIVVMHTFPANAVLMASLLTGRAQHDEFVFFLVIIIAQILIVPVLLFLPALLSSSAHEARRHLVPIQWAIPNAPPLKVKLDAHYGRLIGKQTYGFTVGSLGLVTHRFMFEMLFSYAGAIMFALSRDFA